MNKLTNSLQRKSNIELLRIIAMLSIIGVHYLSSSNAIETIPSGVRNGAYIAVETVFGTGVNIFVLITGYFMIDRSSVLIRKVIKLLFDVTFYGVALFLIASLTNIVDFSFGNFVKSAFPLLFGYRWFVKAWIVLYLLSPFLNKVLVNISKKSFKVLLIIMILLFSVWPFGLPNPPLDDYGYSFWHFIFVYMIAAYIKRFSVNPKIRSCVAILFIAFFATCLIGYIGSPDVPIINIMYEYKWAQNSPLMITASSMIFVIFLRVGSNFSSGKVNTFAASAFGIFLIHGDFNIMGFLFNDICQAQRFYNSWLWVPYMILCVMMIYLACFAIDYIKRNSVDILANYIFDKIGPLNYCITA